MIPPSALDLTAVPYLLLRGRHALCVLHGEAVRGVELDVEGEVLVVDQPGARPGIGLHAIASDHRTARLMSGGEEAEWVRMGVGVGRYGGGTRP